MTTYLYETILEKKDAKPRYYEIRQGMNDEPLTRHPETGEPIRRVILGGYGILRKPSGTAPPGCGCGEGGCYG